MEMKYPSLDQFIKSNFDFSEDAGMDQSFDLVANCIEKIYNSEEAWTSADCTKKELIDFLEQMNSSQFKEIEKFLKRCLNFLMRLRLSILKQKLRALLYWRDCQVFSRRSSHMDLETYYKLNFP